jgi:hypothetical protein
MIRECEEDRAKIKAMIDDENYDEKTRETVVNALCEGGTNE